MKLTVLKQENVAAKSATTTTPKADLALPAGPGYTADYIIKVVMTGARN